MHHYSFVRQTTAFCFLAIALLGGRFARGATSPEQVAGILKSGSETVKLKQLDELSRQRTQPKELAQMLIEGIEAGKDDVHGSTVRMVQLLGDVNDAIATTELLSLLEAKDFRVVMPAIEALGMRKDAAYLDALVGCAKRSEFRALYGFRDCLLSAIAKIADKRSIDFFVEKLPYLDGQLRFDTVVYLSQTTGENLGSDAGAWADWWRADRDDFVFGRAGNVLSLAEILAFYQVLDDRDNDSESGKSAGISVANGPVANSPAAVPDKAEAVADVAADARSNTAPAPKKVRSRRVAARIAARNGDHKHVLDGEMLANFEPNLGALANVKFGKLELVGAKQPMPKFFTVPVLGKNIVFVIDVSGSMAETFDNEAKIAKAKSQLAKAVRDLPGNTNFNAISFSDGFQDWQPRLVPAMPLIKLGAANAIGGLGPQGNTNVYDTMCHAFRQNDNLEAIYLLSDGEPNAGTIPNPGDILIALTQQNMLRRVRIHTIGIDPRPAAEDFLKKLASLNHGTFTRVNKP